ncbi:MAG: transposase [Planctomycetaceae bacterium]|nr:transposase [Planctomycetaceae bacterium]
MSGTNYCSDVKDEQREFLRRLFPAPAKLGRKPLDRRTVLNAILDVLWMGCQWQALPRDFPKWQRVNTNFRRWKISGVWQSIHD